MATHDPSLVGRRVRLSATGEAGVIVHVWEDPEVKTTDCYVAFFGDEIPDGKPEKPPHVLRYFLSSLELIDED